jgi:hypothetical protein
MVENWNLKAHLIVIEKFGISASNSIPISLIFEISISITRNGSGIPAESEVLELTFQ